MRVSLVLRMLALLLGVALLATYADASQSAQQTRERVTVRLLAQTLKRMGEPKLADRLMNDYHNAKRIHFARMHSREANAETGPNRRGVNEITFSNEMLRIADQARLLDAKPYGNSSTLVSWAITVAHEYQHMDQVRPQNLPPWEDPAWKATDQMVSTWAQRLKAEFDQLRKQPASKAREAKIEEVLMIARRLGSEIGNLREGIMSNEKNGSLSGGQSWKLDDTLARLKALQKEGEKRTAVGKMGTPTPSKVQTEGYWELVQTDVFDKLPPSDTNYSIAASNGSITMGWSLNKDIFKFTARWTPPPKQIRPTDRFLLDLSISLDQNAGTDYSANGNVALWIDRPECEPGSVIAPVSLKNETNEPSNTRNVTHRMGVPPSPPIRLILDGKALPTGAKGARFAILVAAYNGRNAGYRYIYEWKTPW